MRIKLELTLYSKNPDTGAEEGPARDIPELTTAQEVVEHLKRTLFDMNPESLAWLGAYVTAINLKGTK